ncbi:hypothetical protein SAMN05216178_3355 [Pseudomonas saponiphila]|uniref:Uncharacterized protein n=1 Tax=Pseudomonas saponiphila TaxID=556534 RepID=A0A1H4PK75_9PSED|nr:hypothetical protein SAMN05216178_3355 [Pseudomonas saponiphila]
MPAKRPARHAPPPGSPSLASQLLRSPGIAEHSGRSRLAGEEARKACAVPGVAFAGKPAPTLARCRGTFRWEPACRRRGPQGMRRSWGRLRWQASSYARPVSRNIPVGAGLPAKRTARHAPLLGSPSLASQLLRSPGVAEHSGRSRLAGEEARKACVAPGVAFAGKPAVTGSSRIRSGSAAPVRRSAVCPGNTLATHGQTGHRPRWSGCALGR